jgi:hypothetical protein
LVDGLISIGLEEVGFSKSVFHERRCGGRDTMAEKDLLATSGS